MDNRWTWAALTGEQLQLVRHAEQTLGDNVKYLLVYQAAADGHGSSPAAADDQPQIAPLSGSQVECLQGLVIAYQ